MDWSQLLTNDWLHELIQKITMLPQLLAAILPTEVIITLTALFTILIILAIARIAL